MSAHPLLQAKQHPLTFDIFTRAMSVTLEVTRHTFGFVRTEYSQNKYLPTREREMCDDRAITDRGFATDISRRKVLCPQAATA